MPGADPVTVYVLETVDDVSITLAMPLVVFSDVLDKVPPVVTKLIVVPLGTPVVLSLSEFWVISAVMVEVEVPLATMLVGLALILIFSHGS